LQKKSLLNDDDTRRLYGPRQRSERTCESVMTKVMIMHITRQCVIHVESEKLLLLQIKTSIDEDSKSKHASQKPWSPLFYDSTAVRKPV